VSFFASFSDSRYTRERSDATRTWYEATAPWSKEEAVKATLSILESLGKELRELSKVDYEAEPLTVADPQGNKVTVVTPFHTVVLWDTSNTPYVMAEFRMGSAGPGRLKRWSDRSR
jgi:hypothetical protein